MREFPVSCQTTGKLRPEIENCILAPIQYQNQNERIDFGFGSFAFDFLVKAD